MPKFNPFQSTYDISKTDLHTTTMKDDHRYDAIRNIDNNDDSSTEVEDWEESEGVKPRRQRKRKTLWRRVKGYRWMVDTVLLLIIVGLLVEKRWNSHKSHRFELAGDISGFAPKFSQQILSFSPDPIYAPENASEFFSKETQKAWLDLVPEGLGYLKIAEPHLYNNLPTPIHDYPNITVFTTSMTHQLHCLYTILEAYNTLQTKPTEPLEMPWHINHCFEYMRQAIMCAGDVALEGAATTFPLDPVTGEDLGGTDGWDAKHVCKDYGEIYRYLEKETINHFKWIGS